MALWHPSEVVTHHPDGLCRDEDHVGVVIWMKPELDIGEHLLERQCLGASTRVRENEDVLLTLLQNARDVLGINELPRQDMDRRVRATKLG